MARSTCTSAKAASGERPQLRAIKAVSSGRAVRASQAANAALPAQAGTSATTGQGRARSHRPALAICSGEPGSVPSLASMTKQLRSWPNHQTSGNG